MPIVEFAVFQASDALIADPLLLKGALGVISKAEGFIRGYTGKELEDPKRFYLALEWESVEAHKKFQASPEFARGSALLKPAFSSPPSMHHVAYEGDYTVAFNAPVTEVAFVKIRDDQTKEALYGAVKDVYFAGGMNDSPGIHLPPARGEVVETPRWFYLVVGWDKVEQHAASVAVEKTVPYIAKIVDIVEPGYTIKHIFFTKIERDYKVML